MTQKTYNVIVHKANISLLTGESIGSFTNELRKGCIEYLKKQLEYVKNIDTYMVESFSDEAIFEVYDYDSGNTYDERRKYYAVGYERDTSGAFTFNDIVEVERVVSFIPKTTDMQIAVLKNAKTFGNDVSQWVEISKSLWCGVL